jgi:hypothetical protein
MRSNRTFGVEIECIGLGVREARELLQNKGINVNNYDYGTASKQGHQR